MNRATISLRAPDSTPPRCSPRACPSCGAPLSSPLATWRFTPRENEVLSVLVLGWSNARIALELGIAERTVEAHLTSMFAKAGVASRAELVARALGGGA